VHEAVVQYTQQCLGKHSTGFRLQRVGISPTAAGVQPDLLLLLPGGGRIPIQACCRNQPGYEAAALLKLCRLSQLGPGDANRVNGVLAVAANRRHMRAIERALKNQNGGILPSRLALLDFDVVIDPQLDWGSILDFQS
jgi:hypothetical protein